MEISAIAICIPGLETITQQEIKEILKVKSKVLIPGRIEFKVKEAKELAELVYKARSIIKVYSLIKYFKFKDLEGIKEEVEKINFPKLKAPFVVRSERKGEHDFNSLDLEKEIGEIIFKKEKIEVDLKEPSTIIILDIIENNCFIGIDYTGTKLSKRAYRVRVHPTSINPCLAYVLIRIAEVKEKEVLLDPLCKSGEIPIEAGLYLKNIPANKINSQKAAFTKLVKYNFKEEINNKKLNIFCIDSLQNNLKSAEINAKIAGVFKDLQFSRHDIEWLDTKFEKDSVDKVVTFLPYKTNAFPEEKVEKIYKELFYQLKFILKKTGKVVILTPTPELLEKQAKLQEFIKNDQIQIEYNNQVVYIISLSKEKITKKDKEN